MINILWEMATTLLIHDESMIFHRFDHDDFTCRVFYGIGRQA